MEKIVELKLKLGFIDNSVLIFAVTKYFPDPATEMFNSMIELHNDIMFYLSFLTIVYILNCKYYLLYIFSIF